MHNCYSAFDDAIVAAIAAGAGQLSAIVRAVGPTAAPLVTPDRGRLSTGRLVEQRLQALRRGGRLRYDWRHGWTLDGPLPPAEVPVRTLDVRSRHLRDYLLLNRADGTAWRGTEVGVADAHWKAVDPNPVAVLQAHAGCRLAHRDRGRCPSPGLAPTARDPACPVCQALLMLATPGATGAVFWDPKGDPAMQAASEAALRPLGGDTALVRTGLTPDEDR